LIASGYRRVVSSGGLGSDTLSVLMRLADASLTSVSTCGESASHPNKVTPTNAAVLRAWIRNNAPNN
jgi:hypothetical protein